jgi:hypothetical protein
MKNSFITFKAPEGKTKKAKVLDSIVENGHTRYLTESDKGTVEIVEPSWIESVEGPKEPKKPAGPGGPSA